MHIQYIYRHVYIWQKRKTSKFPSLICHNIVRHIWLARNYLSYSHRSVNLSTSQQSHSSSVLRLASSLSLTGSVSSTFNLNSIFSRWKHCTFAESKLVQNNKSNRYILFQRAWSILSLISKKFKPYSPCKYVCMWFFRCSFIKFEQLLWLYRKFPAYTHNKLKAYISKLAASNTKNGRENHV